MFGRNSVSSYKPPKAGGFGSKIAFLLALAAGVVGAVMAGITGFFLYKLNIDGVLEWGLRAAVLVAFSLSVSDLISAVRQPKFATGHLRTSFKVAKITASLGLFAVVLGLAALAYVFKQGEAAAIGYQHVRYLFALGAGLMFLSTLVSSLSGARYAVVSVKDEPYRSPISPMSSSYGSSFGMGGMGSMPDTGLHRTMSDPLSTSGGGIPGLGGLSGMPSATPPAPGKKRGLFGRN